MKPCPQPTTPRRSFGGEGIGRTPGFRRPEAGIAARVVPAPTSRWTAGERLRPTFRLDFCCRSALPTALNSGEGSPVAFLVWAKPALPRPSRSMPAGESTISRTDPFSTDPFSRQPSPPRSSKSNRRGGPFAKVSVPLPSCRSENLTPPEVQTFSAASIQSWRFLSRFLVQAYFAKVQRLSGRCHRYHRAAQSFTVHTIQLRIVR